jgi:hypothetical protein
MSVETGGQVAEDFLQKLNSGYYKGSIPYPAPVPEPVVLKRRVSDFTAENINEVSAVLKEYQEAKAAEQRAKEAYHDNQRQMMTEFESDMATYYGMINHPKRSLLYGKAWEHGHAYGLNEVHNWYSDLIDLAK